MQGEHLNKQVILEMTDPIINNPATQGQFLRPETKKAQEDTKQSAPKPVNSEVTGTIKKLNDTLVLGFLKIAAYTLVNRIWEERTQANIKDSLNKEQQQTLNYASSASPLATSKGFKDFAEKEVIAFIETLKGKYKDIDERVFNTAKKILTVIKEKGSISLSDFSKDDEANKVMKKNEQLIKVLLVLQEATDNFMDKAQELLKEKGAVAQKKAEAVLNIAEAIIESEKEIRALELQNQLVLHDRGLSILADA